ncbi:MAG: helix-turn-helix transcriptional regulator [Polyangiales bacterium]
MSKLRRIIKRNGWSESEAARQMGIPQSALNRITNRGLPPTLTTASKIVAAFDGQISYDDLVPADVKRSSRRLRGVLVSAG